ncbi:MAG: NAD(P)H-hydrate dehydratase, partial [Solirubrobacterales bacterium]|nr:NAD(P)H-hydrate dehydratase [Solirubrobacterales bacterium]
MTGLPGWVSALPGSAAMRAADAAAIEKGTPGLALMERAGSGLAMLAGHLIPDGPIAVLCGKGNNGGDGFVAARLLHAAGRDVRVFTTSAIEDSEGDAAENLARLVVRPRPFDLQSLDGCAGAIDALLGTGVSGAPRGAVARAIRVLHASGLPVIACDVPSGVDADTGAVPDPDTVVHASATVTFAAAKPGLWIAPGKAHAGTVHVVDIGVRAEAGAQAGLMEDDEVLEDVPTRAAASTKFTAGHVVLCGGSRGLTGAVCLAAEAATRAGAGYVTACVPHSLEPIFEVKLTEVMTRGVPDAGGVLVPEAAQEVLDTVAARGGVLVLGGGTGRSDGALACVRQAALQAPGPLVLDADGIAAFAGDPEALLTRTAPTLLTPHAGELARLLGRETHAAIEAARLDSVREAARRTGAIVVLKGDDSLIATPDGRVIVSEGGAPALATAGTGDVLAGVCGAFL